MYYLSLSALAFVDDFPQVAPEFPQCTHCVCLRNFGTTDKNHLTKSGTERFREYIIETGGVYDYVGKCKQIVRKRPAGSE